MESEEETHPVSYSTCAVAIVMPRAFSSGALSMASYARTLPEPDASARTRVMAAVRVVLPWLRDRTKEGGQRTSAGREGEEGRAHSTWPMVLRALSSVSVSSRWNIEAAGRTAGTHPMFMCGLERVNLPPASAA